MSREMHATLDRLFTRSLRCPGRSPCWPSLHFALAVTVHGITTPPTYI